MTKIRTMQNLPEEIRNLIAGGLAGMMAKSVVAPLDRIKIMYQVSDVKFHLRRVPSVVLEIIHQEGIRALWRGHTATILRVFPYAGIQFMTFDYCKKMILSKRNKKDYIEKDELDKTHHKHGLMPFESLLAGSFAGVSSVILTYPLDLTRAQLAILREAEAGKKQGFGYVIKSTVKRRGFFGLYRGITPTLVGMMPYAGLAFTINEQGKKHIKASYDRNPSTIERMFIGAIAGLVGQSGTYPFEITRRRMQTVGLVTGSSAESILHTHTLSRVDVPPTLFETIRRLYVQEGVRGFYKGLSMNWIKGPVAFSISFTSYDKLKDVIIETT